MQRKKELLISVNIETSGHIPGEYSMLSLDACTIDDPDKTFYAELTPITAKFLPATMNVNLLSIEDLILNGISPTKAMLELELWLSNLCINGERPIFVALDSAFDWSFVNYYFHRYLKRNPFELSPLDIKSMYFGAMNCSTWRETSDVSIKKKLNALKIGNRNALVNAQAQAEVFRLLKSVLSGRGLP